MSCPHIRRTAIGELRWSAISLTLSGAFSFRVGLHQIYVSSVERGERNVTIETADRIAKALGTTLSSMFSELEWDSNGSDEG